MRGFILPEEPAINREAQWLAVVGVRAVPAVPAAGADDGRTAAQRFGPQALPVPVETAIAAPVVEQLEVEIDVTAQAGAVPAIVVVGPLVQVYAHEAEDFPRLL